MAAYGKTYCVHYCHLSFECYILEFCIICVISADLFDIQTNTYQTYHLFLSTMQAKIFPVGAPTVKCV